MVVWNDLPEKQLGVVDGFRRYFHEALALPVTVSAYPRTVADSAEASLPMQDIDILTLARRRAADLEQAHGDSSDFFVGVEAGMMTAESRTLPGEDGVAVRHFVHCWAVVRGFGEEAWGSSGTVQLPHRLIEGLDDVGLSLAVPGARRRGGMVSSLTRELETRRSAAAQATFHALASLLYPHLQSPTHRR